MIEHGFAFDPPSLCRTNQATGRASSESVERSTRANLDALRDPLTCAVPSTHPLVCGFS
jgi:hypothetical protein